VTTRIAPAPQISYARTAGILYLIIIVCGLFSEIFVRQSLIVAGDPTATAGNILASIGLFRIGFAADSIMLLADVAIAVLFYVVFRPVSQTLSLMAAAFRLTQASVLGFNLLNYHQALLVLDGSGYMGVFTTGQLNSLAMMFLDSHSHGYDLGLLFFGLSTIVLGYLVLRSGNFPRLLGFGLIAAGLVYLTGSYVRFLAPDYVSLVAPAYLVPVLAEVSFCVWLLAKGVSGRQTGR